VVDIVPLYIVSPFHLSSCATLSSSNVCCPKLLIYDIMAAAALLTA